MTGVELLEKLVPLIPPTYGAHVGWIASRPVEAACKTLVTRRLKVRGAKWSRPGASAILYVRSVMQSGRADDALDFFHTRSMKRAAR